jgi:hypothetical protein
MINPYYIYIGTFLISLLLYQLGWSTLFPEMKFETVIFFVSTMVVALVVGVYFHIRKFVSFRPIPGNSKIPVTVLIIGVLWVLEFAYNGGVPIMLILQGIEYDYTAFGIPTVHVFVVTFSSFFTIYLFHVYLSTKNKWVLLYYLFLMSFAMLLFNRGMLMINIVSSVFVYLQYRGRISVKRVSFLLVFSIVVLYFFGVLGSLRSAHSRGEEYSNESILDIAKADEEFVEGAVPKEFIWSYLYISSPLANLQYNIDKQNTREPSGQNTLEFINNEFVFDFISKRINALLGIERVSCLKFVDSMTVASVYTNSFIYMGWLGMIIMAVYALSFPVFYLSLLRKKNVFYVTATSILGSLFLYLIFDNMFTFTGLSFQLIYPLLLGRFFKEHDQPADRHTVAESADLSV